jgi:SAM-dependent methyltransferase
MRKKIHALTPNFKRFWWIIHSLSVNSFTRTLQYELLNTFENLGDVLDFGGGSKICYRKDLNCNSYKSINIDKKAEPTWLINIDDPLPNLKSKFDTIISLNTIEHIYEPSKLFHQLFKALKPGGQILISTPFLFPIHACPDDFFRPTPSWYRRTLIFYGFHNIDVVPLVWGPFSSASLVTGMPGPFKKFRMKIFLLADLVYFYLSTRKISTLNFENRQEKHATAFFVRAIK